MELFSPEGPVVLLAVGLCMAGTTFCLPLSRANAGSWAGVQLLHTSAKKKTSLPTPICSYPCLKKVGAGGKSRVWTHSSSSAWFDLGKDCVNMKRGAAQQWEWTFGGEEDETSSGSRISLCQTKMDVQMCPQAQPVLSQSPVHNEGVQTNCRGQGNLLP